jgi:hypothetical protein
VAAGGVFSPRVSITELSEGTEALLLSAGDKMASLLDISSSITVRLCELGPLCDRSPRKNPLAAISQTLCV